MSPVKRERKKAPKRKLPDSAADKEQAPKRRKMSKDAEKQVCLNLV